jgi:hypothetical protein
MTAIAIVSAVLVAIVCQAFYTFHLKPKWAKEATERARLKAELEAQRPTFEKRCLELFENLKTNRGCFLIWRAPDWTPDFQKEEVYMQEHFWDGAEGRIILKRKYAVSGEYAEGKYEPAFLVPRLSTRLLKEYAEFLPQAVA